MAVNGYFQSFDGTRLFYSVEGSGPPLVFCYGLVCSRLHWSYQIEHFKKHYTCICFDYRGHMRSDFPDKVEKLTISNLARDIVSLLDELQIPQATLLGHSMGVNLVLECFRNNPERVKAMVLANGTARGPLSTFFRTNLLQLAFPLLYQGYQNHPRLANFLWQAQGKSKVVPWIIKQVGFNPNLAKNSDIDEYVQQLSRMDMIITLQLLKDYETFDATHWLHRINVPTLVVAGEKDLVIPREAQEVMHQLIPGSQFEVIRNGSHCPQMDIPELVNAMLERFLERTYDPSSSNESPEPASTEEGSARSESRTSRQGNA